MIQRLIVRDRGKATSQRARKWVSHGETDGRTRFHWGTNATVLAMESDKQADL